ncbi:MAG: flagellar hook-length control protein FliK [Firmicutes bacterium]|nr:flagellar hook-length control protein FliK [Bacillota bacterium]
MFTTSYMPVGNLNGTQVFQPNTKMAWDGSFAEVFETIAGKSGIENKEKEMKNKFIDNTDTKEKKFLFPEHKITSQKELDEEKHVKGNVKETLLNFLAAVMNFVQNVDKMDTLDEKADIKKIELLKEMVQEFIDNPEGLLRRREAWESLLENIESLIGIKMDDINTARVFLDDNINAWLQRVKFKMDEYAQKIGLSGTSEKSGLNDLKIREECLNIQGETLREEYIVKEPTDSEDKSKNKNDEIPENEKDALGLKTEGKTERFSSTEVALGKYVNRHETQKVNSGFRYAEKMKNGTQETQEDFNLLYGNILREDVNDPTDTFSVRKDVTQGEILRKEIVFSIANKAKVLITDKQSEIVINLKPDSLGKVVLKVVTENNYVTAKILTENYKVKEIIESNFQMLKDSLEKQGLIVHDLSVSVKDSESESSPYDKQGEERFITGVKRSKASKSTEPEVYHTGKLGYVEEMFAYNWPYSTINLTA